METDKKQKKSAELKNQIISGPQVEALKIAAVYGFFGMLWILLSDRLLLFFTDDLVLYSQFQTYKGIIYVVLTVFLIYVLVYKRTRVISRYFNRLQDTAFIDRLTRLPNRAKLSEKLDVMIADKQSFYLVYLNLDDFRIINDTLGHLAGDRFLQLIADELGESLRKEEFLARIGGDDFGIIIPGTDSEGIDQRIEEIKSGVKKYWSSDNHRFYVSFSVGVIHYPTHTYDASELLKRANIAMYQGKKTGKRQTLYFEDEYMRNVTEHINMTNKLQDAIDREELTVHYQAVCELRTGTIRGMEALVRWQSEEDGFISPDYFIPLAEETGQIFEIDNFVFKDVVARKKELEKNGLLNISIGLNLSSTILMSDIAFPKFLNNSKNMDCDYTKLVIEITETAIINDLDVAIERIGQLKSLGFKIALDDFGTGYSSLTHLKRIPIDMLKLDQSFIEQIIDNEKDAVIIDSVISMAQNLDVLVIVEGVENAEQLEYLKKYDKIRAQGYLMHRPEEFGKLFQKIERAHT